MSEVALASYDVLKLTSLQAASADGATEGELHTLAYLACLLSVYDGREASWWGYRFTATRSGAPFAYSLDQSVAAARRAGLIAHADHVWSLTDRGRIELELIDSLILNQRRGPYLDGAAGTALSMPLPTLGSALRAEPALRRALRFVRTQELLDEAGVVLLEQQFKELNAALDNESLRADLMVPAVVWLTYLSRTPNGVSG